MTKTIGYYGEGRVDVGVAALMSQKYEKLKTLLKALFQLDQPADMISPKNSVCSGFRRNVVFPVRDMLVVGVLKAKAVH